MASSDEQFLAAQPPRAKVEKAIAESRAGSPGRVLKVLYLDEQGESVGEWASSQLPENPFSAVAQTSGLQEPPYPLEQLVFLAESHPVHSSALEQKTADICGEGWSWEAEDPDVADEALRDELQEWLESLAPDDMDIEEIINAAWLDKETIGWGLIELARDPSGVLRRVYHVPAHTVRAHKDGFRLCQIRDQQKVWFRRWGIPDVGGVKIEVDVKTGSMKSIKTPASDLFVLKSPSRRSSWYGIPGYVSAIGWITLALAARDDNIMFFQNRREPRWAIIITGLDDTDDELEEGLRRSFTVDLKQPYRNLLIPLAGNAKVDFQKMSDTAKDGSFGNLSERADKAIMVAHRLPAERLANSETGALGGNNVVASNRIYKDAVVDPGQRMLNKRMRRMIEVEYGIKQGTKREQSGETEKHADLDVAPAWLFTLNDLDISSEKEDLDVVVVAFKNNLVTLREARQKLKYSPLMRAKEIDPETGKPAVNAEGELADEDVESPYNDLLFCELPGAKSSAPEEPEEPVSEPVLQNRDPALALIDADVRDLLTSSRAVHDRLEELAEEQQRQREP